MKPEDQRESGDPPRPGHEEGSETSVPVELRRAYRDIGDETPPDLIDRAVLNRARIEIETRRRAWPWTRGWAHNLATAFVVALAVTLLLQLRDDAAQPELPTARPPAPAGVRQADRPALAPQALPRAELRERAAQEPLEESAAFAEEGESVPREDVDTPAMRVSSAVDGERLGKLAEKPAADSAEPDPEAWLERIRLLHERGDVEAATRELEAFRESYPDYPVPGDLLD